MIFSVQFSQGFVVCKFTSWKRRCCRRTKVTKAKATVNGNFPVDIMRHSAPVPKLSSDHAILFPYVLAVTGVTRSWQQGDVVNCDQQTPSHFMWLIVTHADFMTWRNMVFRMFRDHHRSEKPIWVTGPGWLGMGPGCDLATRGKPLPVMRVATGFCSSLKPSTAQPNIHCHFNLANTSPLFFSPSASPIIAPTIPKAASNWPSIMAYKTCGHAATLRSCCMKHPRLSSILYQYMLQLFLALLLWLKQTGPHFFLAPHLSHVGRCNCQVSSCAHHSVQSCNGGFIYPVLVCHSSISTLSFLSNRVASYPSRLCLQFCSVVRTLSHLVSSPS